MKLRNLMALLGVIGLVIVVWLNRGQFVGVWRILKTLRWYILAFVILIQLASYWVNGLYYRSILRIFGYEMSIRRLFEGALATNFVNYVLPSAGIAGAGYLSQVLAPDVPRGESVLTQLTRYALSGLAVLIMMPVGLLLVLFTSNSAHQIVRITLLSALAITVFAVFMVAVVQQESAVYRSVDRVVVVLKRAFPKIKPDAIRHFVDDFYLGWHRIISHKRHMLAPFEWSIIYIVIEMGTFYLTFLAFGKLINPGISIMAYLFANIASIFGGVFFSTGTFEVGMAGTLVVLGLPFPLAVSVTSVYRVLNLLIGLPPGFYFYRRYLPPKPSGLENAA
ncbi:MAG: lysylphosphatidylglycerol synthase transmembrane domain-containing protein [Actinomycetota bacterium]|nr:lysylphosphatidylglycerol synthase transmembrane domain-containing protein [Actinomycetota bacterium]